MSDTATAKSVADRSDYMDDRSLHNIMNYFSERWTAKLEPREAAQFHADLLLLVQAIHRDASKTTNHLLMTALAAMPPMSIRESVK